MCACVCVLEEGLTLTRGLVRDVRDTARVLSLSPENVATTGN